MSMQLKDLNEDFRGRVVDLIKACAARGIQMQPYYTLRTPFEQAKLWRKSRTHAEVEHMIKHFKENDAEFLAYCLESVGPQTTGRWETDSPPGLSWHQWGEAVDCVWIVQNKSEWSTSKLVNSVNGYEVYAAEAAKLGLTHLGASIGDWVHVQFRKEPGPHKLYNAKYINDLMEKRFA